MKKKSAILLALCFFFLHNAFAATPILIDLASTPRVEKTVDPGEKFDIIAEHRLYKSEYNLSCKKSILVIEPLKSTAQNPAAASNKLMDTLSRKTARGPSCQNKEFMKIIDDIKNTDEESKLATYVRNGQIAMKDKSKMEGCQDEQMIFEALERESRGILNSEPLSLKDGEQTECIISRPVGTSEKRWAVAVTTGAKGDWRVSYGFAFMKNHDREYFAKSNGNNTYTITLKSQNHSIEFAPMVLFSWFPYHQNDLYGWNFGFAGGLGIDFKQQPPLVLVGPNFIYNQNLMLTIGAAYQQQKRLSGQYSEGQLVNENLTSDQLNSSVNMVNFFFSLTFRFDSNPFSGDSSKKDQKNGTKGSSD